MKIGIDCRSIVHPGFGQSVSIGHYALCLVQAMVRHDQANRYVLFVDANLAEEAVQDIVGPHAPHVQVVRFPFATFSRYLPTLYQKTFLPALYARHGLDVLFEPTAQISGSFPGKKVVAVHDARHLTPASRKANHFIVPSEFVKKELIHHKIRPEHISVISYGVTKPQVGGGANFALTLRYVLFVGTITPEKNLHIALQAFAKWCRENSPQAQDMSFVIAGLKGPHSEATFEEIEHINQEMEQVLGRKPIRYVGYVSATEKWQLLQNAMLFVYPSLRTNGGHVLLEAMAAGTPILASSRGAIPEILGTAGLLVEPEYATEFHHALARLLKDEESRKHFSEKGKHHAALYTWDRAAALTLKALHVALMTKR